MKKIYFLLIALSALTTAWSQAVGDYRSAGTGGPWGTLASWERLNDLTPVTWATPTEAQGYPGEFANPEAVTILNGDAITLDVSPDFNIESLAIAGGNAASTLTFVGANILIVNGAVTMGDPTDGTSDKTIAVGAGSLSAGSLSMGNPGGGDDDCILSLTTGTVTVFGNIAMPGTNTENFITISGAGRLDIGGAITGAGGGTITAAAASIVNYNGVVAQTIRVNGTNYIYGNLWINNTSAAGATLQASLNATNLLGNIEVGNEPTNSLFNIGTNDILFGGPGAKTLTVGPGSTMTALNNGLVSFASAGGIVNIHGTFRTADLDGFSDGPSTAITSTPVAPTISPLPTSTVEYNAATGGGGGPQVITARNYVNLTISNTRAKTWTLTSYLSVFGDLTISANSPLTISSIGAAQGIILEGNWIKNSTAAFTPVNSIIAFAGAAAQEIGGTQPTTFNHITFANTNGGITLTQPITVTGDATFTNGVVFSDATNVLIFNDGATSSLTPVMATTPSFVDGPVRKIGDDPFTFPIGAATGFVPLSITAPNNVADAFTAQYFRGFPPERTDITAPGIIRISDCDYWDLAETNDAGAANTIAATFYWNANNPCNGPYVTQPSTIKAVHYIGGSWSAASAANGTGSAASGSVVFAGLTTFSPFTLGSTSLLENPLPVVFADVKAYEKNSGVQIEWSNLTEKDVAAYAVERSSNGRDFVAIAQQLPTSNQNDKASYNAFDAAPVNGTNYYRIKAEETTGKIEYSKILSVNLGKETQSLRLYPNPVTGSQVTISLSNIKRGQYTLKVINTSGQEVYKHTISNQGSTMTQTLNLPNTVKAGVYNMIVTGDNYREIKKFVVQ